MWEAILWMDHIGNVGIVKWEIIGNCLWRVGDDLMMIFIDRWIEFQEKKNGIELDSSKLWKPLHSWNYIHY